MKKFIGIIAALHAVVGCAPEGASDVADEAPASSSQAVLVVSDLSAAVAGPSSGGTGSSATYTVTVSNLQNVVVNGVAASVTLPAGAVLLSLGPGCTAGAAPSAVRCSFGVLGGLASASRTLTVLLPFTPGAGVVSARAVFAGTDSNPANDLGSLPVTVFSAPLPSIPVAPPQRFLVTNCFGISSYAQCNPPPQNRGVFTLDVGGVIPLGARTDMSGAWAQPGGAGTVRLQFFREPAHTVISTFDGVAISSTCFEGTVVGSNGVTGVFRACAQ